MTDLDLLSITIIAGRRCVSTKHEVTLNLSGPSMSGVREKARAR